jgi:ATP-dependent Clp protease ATP-binding subunit ClpB
MDFNTYTTKAAGAVEGALAIVRERGQQTIEPLHLFAALLSSDSGIVLPLLKKLGKDTSALLALANEKIATFPRVSGGGEPYIGSALREVFTRADKEAKRLHDQYVSTEHLFLALIEDSSVKTIAGVSRSDVERELAVLRGSQHVTD